MDVGGSHRQLRAFCGQEAQSQNKPLRNFIFGAYSETLGMTREESPRKLLESVETFFGFPIKTVGRARQIVQLCCSGKLKFVSRTLSELEEHQIRSGSVFVFDDNRVVNKWRDGRAWTASTVVDDFEEYLPAAGKENSLGRSIKCAEPFKLPLNKYKVSLFVGSRLYHLITYLSKEDLECEKITKATEEEKESAFKILCRCYSPSEDTHKPNEVRHIVAKFVFSVGIHDVQSCK